VTPADPPLSLAYVCPSWPPQWDANGIVQYIDTITRGLRARGHRTTLLVNHIRKGTEISEGLYDLGVFRMRRSLARKMLDRLEYRANVAQAVDRSSRRALAAASRRAIEERGVQLLEMEESFGWSLDLGRKLSIPLVVRLHGPWFLNGPVNGFPDDEAFRRRVRLEGEAIRRAEWVTSPSRMVLERTRDYYGLPLERAEVLPNPAPPVSPAALWRLEDSEPQSLLFVGRFTRLKGGDLVIDAFAKVAARFPEARLRFVGPDEGHRDEDRRLWKIQDYIAARISDDGIRNRIEYLGQLPNSTVMELRRKALVSLVCSRHENFPTAVTESMALGCPILAARTGGIPEQIDHGVTGLLFAPGDVDDLAEKMARLLEDPALAARLGEQARLQCDRLLSVAAVSARMAAFYGRVLRDR
jgi:glycosyltransferase involved in cell wall biosynthesis